MKHMPPDPNAGDQPGDARPLGAAEDLLDTAPSPRVRAAILRAAADATRAGRAPRAVAKATPGHGGPLRTLAQWLSWRPALPVAVAIAVGIFAIALTVQVEEDRPGDNRAPASAAAPAAEDTRETVTATRAAPAVAAKPVMPPAAPASPAGESAGVAGNRQEDAAAARAAMPAPRPEAAAAADASRREPAAEIAPRPAQGAEPRAGASAAKNAPVQIRPTADEAASGATDAPAPSATAAPSATTVPSPTAARTSAAGPARAGAPDTATVLPATEWLRRIVGLRAAHADAVADRELAAFIRAYPDVAVPDAARRH